MSETIFHKILAKEIPADVVYEDEDVLAFKDIHPKAKTHLLFIPKTFIASVKEAVGEHAHIPGMLIEKARQYAEKEGIDGYKVTFHVGPEGGQEIMYIHLHMMSDQVKM